MHKDPAWCPQCKAPFMRLVTYRALDGTLSDFPAEESVCLLKRACWFQAHLRVRRALLLHHFKGVKRDIFCPSRSAHYVHGCSRQCVLVTAREAVRCCSSLRPPLQKG